MPLQLEFDFESFRPPDRAVLAYVAGIIDGEGSIGFARQAYGNRPIFPRILIVNSNIEILKFVQGIFGGDIQSMYRAKEHWKPTWMWRLSGKKTVEFLSLIQPWVLAKQDQIVLVFAWAETRHGCSNRAVDKETQEFLADCMHFQNHRGKQIRQNPLDLALAEMEAPLCH